MIGAQPASIATHRATPPLPSRIPIRLPGGDWIFVEAHFPLTEADWEYFMGILQAQKTGLVEDGEPEDNPD